MAKGISLDLTQLALVFGGGALLYYLYISDLPPFNSLPKLPDFRNPAPEEIPDGGTADPNDPIPDKDHIRFDFSTGGTSGSAEEDFFRVLARQRELLALSPGFQNDPIQVGDPNIPIVGTQQQAAQLYGLQGMGPIVFDQNGNPVVIPVTTTGVSPGACTSTCNLQCDKLYPTNLTKNQACKTACASICSNIVQSQRARSYRAKVAMKANRDMSRMKDVVQRQTEMLREKRPKRNVVGVKVFNPKRIYADSIVSAGMRLRPILLSSTGEMHLQNKVANG